MPRPFLVLSFRVSNLRSCSLQVFGYLHSMSSQSGKHNGSKIPPGVFVLILLLLVVGMFALFHLPTQEIRQNELAIKNQENNGSQADLFMELMNSGKNILNQGITGAEK